MSAAAAAATTASTPRLIRYTSLISPRIDPFLSLAIGVAAYHLHERDAVADDNDKLLPLLRRKIARMSSHALTSEPSSALSTATTAPAAAETA
ncbi:hypothetical protein HDU86_001868 [Geranomyces michiganensis]|nr:hypothetical protein HDU86_001868 [Geranomyces michiganensis]